MTDNMRIWSQVEKTDPTHTKKVQQRGGFTAISAAYQIKRATETFGPIGEGWGYEAGAPIFHDALVFVQVTLWHSGDRSSRFGPMTGGAEWKTNKGHIDSDAIKKATTDALTKLLSQLGFNADVFLGLFDDNKYLAEVRAEFAEPKADAPRGKAQQDAPQESAAVLAAGVAIDLCKTEAALTKWSASNAEMIAKLDATDKAEVRRLYGVRLEKLRNASREDMVADNASDPFSEAA